MNQPTGKWNEIIDASTRSLLHDELTLGVPVTIEDYRSVEFIDYLAKGKLPFSGLPVPHKKALEFFFSFKLLNPEAPHHFLDLAGGRSVYLASLGMTSACANFYLNDHIFNGVRVEGGVTIVGGDAGNVQCPDSSIDRISCHHAFEHFQGDTDSTVIRELARLLKPGGIACLIPLFLTTDFIECWNIPHAGTFDPAAKLVLDPTASIPGAEDDGHFARFYDLQAVRRRVLDVAEQQGLRARVVVCRLDGQDLPDMKHNFGSVLNFPMRALILEK